MNEIPNKRKLLGGRIRQLRENLKQTAKQLAADSQISASYLSEIEQGVSAISTEKLLRIAQNLGVTLDQLLGESEIPSPKGRREVRLPLALTEAAEELQLSFSQTMKLYHALQTLRAKRGEDEEWSKQRWIRFYKDVQDYLEG